MAELIAIEQALEILRNLNMKNSIIEVDSELTINSIKRIANGLDPEKISHHWRLLQVYWRIQSHLRILRTLSFAPVRRNANKVADRLANEGVLCKNEYSFYNWEMMPVGNLREECYSLARADNELFLKSGREEDGDPWFI